MKQIKDYIAAILYKIIFFCVKLIPVNNGSKHLLIIKPDEIGDYFLFRNLFKSFKLSEKYKDYTTTLIGNKVWKLLYEEYDGGIFDNTIWIDKKKFNKDLLYRFKILFQVRRLRSTTVINCIYSRSTIFDDGMAFVAKGAEKIAMKFDYTNRGVNEYNLDNFIYNKVINAGDERIFDPIRNRNYLSAILNLPNLSFSTKLKVMPKIKIPQENYFIVFLGAGNPERRWPVHHFVAAMLYTHSKYNLTPMLCGGPGDEKDAIEIIGLYKENVLNFAGKTSLIEMVELISKAEFLLCVDTGALHIAAALGIPVVGLYSGKFYQRFAPYPFEITKHFYPVYPDFVDKMIIDQDQKLYDTKFMKNDTIKMIPPIKVYPFIDKVMEPSTL